MIGIPLFSAFALFIRFLINNWRGTLEVLWAIFPYILFYSFLIGIVLLLFNYALSI